MLTDPTSSESDEDTQYSSQICDTLFDAYIDNLVDEQVELGTLEAAFEISEKELLDSLEGFEQADESETEREDNETILQKVWSRLHSNKPSEYMSTRIFTCLMVCWFLTSIIRFSFTTEGTLATRPPAPPVPFFPSTSQKYLKDYYSGNGAHPKTLLRHSEIAILFYYAPWSLHSMEARKPFMEVAVSFSHVQGVSFNAVNCYAKFGECRKVYKLYSFPVIAAYIDGAHILFNDQFTSSHIFSFVSHLLNPISRLHNFEEYDQIFDTHENAVVGYFPDLKNSTTLKNYHSFIVAAMKSIQSSILHSSTRFAIVQNNTLARKLGFGHHNEIRLFNAFTPNVQAIFDPAHYTKSNDILEWAKNFVSQHSRPLVEWLNLAENELGGKSDKLQTVLNQSSALILFTDHYGGFARSQSYEALRQVALDYLNCDEEEPGLVVVDRVIPNKTKMSLKKKVEEARRACRKEKASSREVMSCCSKIQKSGVCKNWSKSVEIAENVTNQTCGSLMDVFRKEELCGRCCSSSKNPVNQLRTIKHHDKKLCEWYRMLRRNGQTFSELHKTYEDVSTLPASYSRGRIFGMSCKTNETLQFLAIDKSSAGHFLKTWNLGFDLTKNEDLVAIVSTKREGLYRMVKRITRSRLEDFVSAYHSHKLPTIQRSEEHRQSAFSRPNQDVAIYNSQLQRLTAITFQELLNNRSILHDSVIFFSSGSWHGPSTAVVYNMHILSNYFREFDGLIKFYIIDVSRNSLPYQYFFERLPAMMFIPSRRNMNSARFPSNLPFTVPNLLAFILARCQPELRWRIAISSCTDGCLKQNLMDLKAFTEAVDVDLKKLKTLKTLLVNEGNETKAGHVETLIERRLLQRHSATHLDNLIHLLQYKQTKLSNDEKDVMVKDSMFIRWMLYNRFGHSYQT